jgi:Tyrosyl-DNA phosphodiesterase
MVLSWQRSTTRTTASLLNTSQYEYASRIRHFIPTGISSLSTHLILRFAPLAIIHSERTFVSRIFWDQSCHGLGYHKSASHTSSTWKKMAELHHDIVDLTGESDSTLSATSEDDDLHRAIALSLQSVPTSPPGDSHVSTAYRAVSGKPEPQSEPARSVGGISGIDRKRQEEERLARLKRKREQTVSPPLLKRDLKSLSTADPATGTIRGATKANVSKTGCTDGLGTSTQRPRSALQYPEGVVKKTWAFGFERTNDIKLEEVLQPSRLEAAVLSSFQWDWDWLLPKMDTRRTKFVFVLQAKDEQTKEHYRADFSDAPNVRLCFPPMEGQVNCMHSKLMLLFYATHLRVVVPTANLVPYDWGEPFQSLRGGVMENTVFLVDLPKRGPEGNDDQSAEIPFLQSMLYFLKAWGLPEDVIKKLQNFDFSKLEQTGFVHSIGGPHYGDTWRETGACGLGQCLHKLGLRTSDFIETDFVTSSLGSLDEEFLRSLYLVAQGDSGLSEYTLRTAKAIPPAVSRDLERRLGKDFSWGWKQHFRFYYPSEDTVRSSKGGPACGGTICFQSRWWNGPKFPRNLMRDCQSQRQGMLMHNKVSLPISPLTLMTYPIALQIWFTRYAEPVSVESGQRALGWAYVGSANLSESAW